MPYTPYIQETEDGGLELCIERDSDGHTHHMPIEALPNWAELLGYSDLADVAEAIVRIREDETDPGPDPKTGKNLFTEVNIAIQAREQAREIEVLKAVEEGKVNDPRSPRLRGALAARKAIVEPMGEVADGDSILCCSQRELRGSARCPEPHTVRATARTGADFTCNPNPRCGDPGEDFKLCTEDREKLAGVLAPHWDHIRKANAAFLHSRGHDPTGPDPLGEDPVQEAPAMDTVDDLVAKYKKRGTH